MVIRRFFLLLAVMILICGTAYAGIDWPEETTGEKILKQYIETVNTYLEQQGESKINRGFEIYPLFAVLGITLSDDAEIPEDVEITVKMSADSLDSLELIVRDIPRFPAIASSFLRALFADEDTASSAVSVPAEKATQALRNPDFSFGEEIYEEKGNAPRIYYNYYPKRYNIPGNNWLVMTIIFPHKGMWDGSDVLTVKDEEDIFVPDEEIGEAYEGYYSEDDYSHFNVYVTPTPEPDSAAAEYDFR